MACRGGGCRDAASVPFHVDVIASFEQLTLEHLKLLCC